MQSSKHKYISYHLFIYFAQDGTIYPPVIFNISAITMWRRLILINIKVIIYDQINNHNPEKL